MCTDPWIQLIRMLVAEVCWMFKHILVPTDLTEKSVEALAVAVKMALHDESRITLLHVIETIEDSESDEFDDFYRKLAKRALKRTNEMLNLYEGKELVIAGESEGLPGKIRRAHVAFAGGGEGSHVPGGRFP